MKKDSAIRILPSYRRQLNDAKFIFAILAMLMIASDIYLLVQSESIKVNIFVWGCLVAATLSIFAYLKYLPSFLKSESSRDFYLGAAIEYTFVMSGFCPLYLYLFVEQHWSLLNLYGTGCLFLFNRYINWILPSAVFFMVSCTYWLITYLIRKESKMYYLLEKKKEKIYE